jgi:outer membrane lipopolysaccharide assembly protein LptE/RlpB
VSDTVTMKLCFFVRQELSDNNSVVDDKKKTEDDVIIVVVDSMTQEDGSV